MTYVQAVIIVYLLCAYVPTESAGSLTRELSGILARRLVVRETVDLFENRTGIVIYTPVVFGQQSYWNLKACAEASMYNQYLALRVSEATGDCDPLTWDWGSDPQFETGYAYMRKIKTVQSYDPPINITERVQWLLPGILGVNGSVDLYITIPSGISWDAFEIMMLNTTEYGFQTYDSEPEVIMVYIQIERQWNDVASAHFKIWNGEWANKLFLRSTSLADGNAHKFTFVPNADVMQILIDDEEVLQYEHATDPTTAKQISIDPYDIPGVELHNITFVGV